LGILAQFRKLYGWDKRDIKLPLKIGKARKI
jgi:hypothetical protein